MNKEKIMSALYVIYYESRNLDLFQDEWDVLSNLDEITAKFNISGEEFNEYIDLQELD